MKTRTFLAGILLSLAAVGTTPASAQTLHYSWVTITGDTTLQPGQSVLLGLQAEFTGADGYAGGQFNIRIDGFAHGDDSVWIAGTRGVDNLSRDGDSQQEVRDDGVGRIPRFRNVADVGDPRYALTGDLIVDDHIDPVGFIEHFQFGQPAAEPDRSNPITFFTIEFFAGDTFGDRVLNPQIGSGSIYILRRGFDDLFILSPDMISADPITITVVPAPASLTLFVLVGLGARRRRKCERRHT